LRKRDIYFLVIASIPTGGPGLFVRSYSKNPEYPYVWADTAFGEHHDEIEVYDAHTFALLKRIKADTPSAVSNIGIRIEELGL